MSIKHRLKLGLRRVVAWVLHGTGLRRLFAARRGGVPVLMFHNVGHPPETDYLPGHMKVGEERLAKLLELLARSGYRTLTLDGMVSELEAGRVPQDAVVLTFDDGYRDNHDRLLPLLQRHGATATVFVQTGPMKGRLNWLHQYFWILHRVGPHELGRKLAERVEGEELRDRLRALPSGAGPGEYALKRLLKYEVAESRRDALLADVFTALGGDEGALARAVWLDADACRALDRAGVEIGAHTENHLVLSSLDKERQRAEIESSRKDLEGWLGHAVPSFAYPYGRTWDFNEDTLAVLRDLGFRCAITAMPGVNAPDTPRLQLRRYAVNDEVSLAELMCEVDGAFAWLARRGLDLSA